MLSNDFNYVKGNREDGTEGDYKSTLFNSIQIILQI